MTRNEMFTRDGGDRRPVADGAPRQGLTMATNRSSMFLLLGFVFHVRSFGNADRRP
jgi:hypothetical protein